MTNATDGTERNLGTFKFDDLDGEKRLAELMLHIAHRCEDDPGFGATKLNKILWWSDFLSYARNGEPITGVEYQRLGNGPAPKRLVPIRKKMVSARHAALQERAVFGGRDTATVDRVEISQLRFIHVRTNRARR